MKKFMSLLLVLTMCFSLGVTALASGEAAEAEAEAALLPEEAAAEAEAGDPIVTDAEDPAPAAEADVPAEETVLPELFTGEVLPEEELTAGVESIEETVSQEAQAAGTETEAKSYTAAFGSATECSGNVTLAVGGSVTVNPTVNASGSPKFKFSSNSNESVAASSPTGSASIQDTDGKVITITGIAVGEAVIVYTYTPSGGTDQGKTFTLTINVTVNETGEGDNDGFTADAGSESGDSGSGSGSDSGSTDSGTGVQYAAANELTAGMNAAFAVGGYTFGVDRGSVYVGAATVTDGQLTVETSNWIQVVENGAGGLALVVEDPPGETTYLSLDAGGLKCEKTSAIPGGSWAYAGGKLSYTADGVTYYITGADASGVTVGTDAAAAADVALYTGTAEPQKAPPPDSSEPADDAAPIIVKQPAVVPYVIEGSGYDAPTYTVEAKLPENSESRSIYFQWWLDGETVGEQLKISKDDMTGGTASSTVTVDALKGRTAGLYRVLCEVWCNTNGGTEKHSVDSFTVSFLVCKGVQSNSFITFSDVHETFDNVGTAIYDSMMVNEGYVPALIICTGDWANGNYMGEGAGSDNYNATMDSYIERLRAQAAGIDMIFVSGNHDNGAAAADATAAAGLGAAEDYDGVGVAYDSRTASDGSGAANTGLIVFGINYEALAADGGGYSYAGVIPALESFFQDLAADYHGELVVISAHAGLHVLGLQTGSTASSAWSGGNEYNVDKSDEVVSLLNKYGETMDIMFFFGHDHSKSEAELVLKPGDTIVSTVSYASQTSKEQTINFSYGHAGYITNTIGGEERYSQVSWDDETISRVMAVVNDNDVAELTYDITRVPKPEVVIGRLEDNAITQDLKDKGLDTAAKIGEKLTAKVEELGFSAGSTVLYDAALMVKNDKGVLVEVAPDDFPASGVTVRFPYPEGTNAGEYKFTVVHMFSRGEKAGEMEVLQPVLTEDGIEVTVKSLSPFAISWQLKDAAGGDNAGAGGGSVKRAAPPTGDGSHIALWAAVLVLCAGGVTAIVLPRKKRN